MESNPEGIEVVMTWVSRSMEESGVRLLGAWPEPEGSAANSLVSAEVVTSLSSSSDMVEGVLNQPLRRALSANDSIYVYL